MELRPQREHLRAERGRAPPREVELHRQRRRRRRARRRPARFQRRPRRRELRPRGQVPAEPRVGVANPGRRFLARVAQRGPGPRATGPRARPGLPWRQHQQPAAVAEPERLVRRARHRPRPAHQHHRARRQPLQTPRQRRRALHQHQVHRARRRRVAQPRHPPGLRVRPTARVRLSRLLARRVQAWPARSLAARSPTLRSLAARSRHARAVHEHQALEPRLPRHRRQQRGHPARGARRRRHRQRRPLRVRQPRHERHVLRPGRADRQGRGQEAGRREETRQVVRHATDARMCSTAYTGGARAVVGPAACRPSPPAPPG